MFSTLTFEQVTQLALAFVIGGGGAAVVAKRTLKNLSATGAEIDVIEMLRKEVARLSAANDLLTQTVGELREELLQLREENAELRALLRPKGPKPPPAPPAPPAPMSRGGHHR